MREVQKDYIKFKKKHVLENMVAFCVMLLRTYLFITFLKCLGKTRGKFLHEI